VEPDTLTQSGARNPQALERADHVSPENAHEFKRFDCRYYCACLTVAANGNWPQFHCNDCHAYEAAEMDDSVKRLAARFARLLVRRE
jgi:hypothetical protein